MRRARVTSAVLMTLGASFGLGSSLFAQADAPNPVVSYVYLGEHIYNGENNPFTDQIAAFAVHKDGTAEAVAGSPFAGDSFNVVANHRFVFSTGVPTVSNQISTFARSHDGALVQVSSTDGAAHNDYPGSSYVNGLALDQTGHSLYVGEEGTGDEYGLGQYANFSVNGDAPLQFRNETGLSTNYAQNPLVFSADNRLAYTSDCASPTQAWSVTGFYRGDDGDLAAFDPGAGNPIPYYCPIGGIATSTTGYLAVGAGVALTPSPYAPQIALYKIEASGQLDLLSTTVGTGLYFGISSLQFDPTGKYLAASNAVGVQVYQVNGDGSLTALPLALPDAYISQVSWDDDGHLFAPEFNTLHILSVQNGAVTELGTPIATSGNYSLAVVSAHGDQGDSGTGGDDGNDQ